MTRLMLAIALALGTLTSLPSPMRASQDDCADALTWPSFFEVAPTARSIYLVRVTRSVDGIALKARSVEVMKGAAPTRIDLRTLQPGRTSDECLEPIGPFA